MQVNNMKSLSRMAAFCVAAFVFCVALTGATHTAAGAADKKAYTKGYRAVRKGDYEQAEKIFREMLNKDGHDIEARLGLSFTMLKQRNLQGAYDNAARVIMLDPLSARGHALLGSAILGAGEFRLSVEEFRTALALNENEALAVAGLAMVDLYENRLPLALPGLRKAAGMDPDEPDYAFNLGQAAARSEKYKEAADAYERFLIIAPKTDYDRRARIVGLIDFLRYLGRQGSLYVPGGEYRSSVPFEATDNRPILQVRINGQKGAAAFCTRYRFGMSVISDKRKTRLKPVAKAGARPCSGWRESLKSSTAFSIDRDWHGKIETFRLYRKFSDATIRSMDIWVSVVSKFLTSIDYGPKNVVWCGRTRRTGRELDHCATPETINRSLRCAERRLG
jgi:tetratricopeptide (TPR) repeat protein